MDMTFDAVLVLRQLGAENFDAATQQQLVLQLQQTLYDRMWQHFQERMTGDDLKTFTSIADDAQAQAWLVQRFPEYRTWFEADLQDIVSAAATQADAAVAAVQAKHQQ